MRIYCQIRVSKRMTRMTTRFDDSFAMSYKIYYFDKVFSYHSFYSYHTACSLSNTDDSNLGKRKRDHKKEDEILMDVVGIVEEASCDLEEYSFKVRSK